MVREYHFLTFIDKFNLRFKSNCSNSFQIPVIKIYQIIAFSWS